MNLFRLFFVISALLLTGIAHGEASTPIDRHLHNLQEEIDRLQSKVSNLQSSASLILYLFAAFCALWAQNTGRNAWLWFFLGAFFNIFAVFVVLIKNSHRHRRKHHPKIPRFQLPRSPHLE